MKSKMRITGNRTVIGIICIVLALGITFGIAPLVNRFTDRKVVLTRLCGVIPEVADLGVETGLNVALDERIHDTQEQNADNNADDDTDGLIDIELGFGIGNGGLRLAVNLVALVVDGFLGTIKKILDFVEHDFYPFVFEKMILFFGLLTGNRTGRISRHSPRGCRSRYRGGSECCS